MRHVLAATCFLVKDADKLALGFVFAFSQEAHFIEKVFGIQVIYKHFTIIFDVNQIEWMKAVLLVNVDIGIDVLENIDDTGGSVFGRSSGGIDAKWYIVGIAVFVTELFDVEMEFVEPEIHYIDTTIDFFEVDNFFLKALELVFAIFEVWVHVFQHVFAGTGDADKFGAVFDTSFEIDVGVKGNVRPEIDELDGFVFGADAVDTTEALDNANWVPVDVVVDEIIAILEVLTFGDTVGGDQNVDVGSDGTTQGIAVFGFGAEIGKDFVEIFGDTFQGGVWCMIASNYSSVKIVVLEDFVFQLFVA